MQYFSRLQPVRQNLAMQKGREHLLENGLQDNDADLTIVPKEEATDDDQRLTALQKLFFRSSSTLKNPFLSQTTRKSLDDSGESLKTKPALSESINETLLSNTDKNTLHHGVDTSQHNEDPQCYFQASLGSETSASSCFLENISLIHCNPLPNCLLPSDSSAIPTSKATSSSVSCQNSLTALLSGYDDDDSNEEATSKELGNHHQTPASSNNHSFEAQDISSLDTLKKIALSSTEPTVDSSKLDLIATSSSVNTTRSSISVFQNNNFKSIKPFKLPSEDYTDVFKILLTELRSIREFYANEKKEKEKKEADQHLADRVRAKYRANKRRRAIDNSRCSI